MKNRILTHRKNDNGTNIGFKYINPENDYEWTITLEKIIPLVNATNEFSFKTKDADGSLTLVTVVDGYLKSLSNDGHSDNVDSLPTY